MTNFSKIHGINEEESFAWWIPYVERKRKAIISKLKYKYWQRTHKYGIKIPKSVNEAYEFDEENVNKLCTGGIKEEMNKVRLVVQESNFSPEKLIGHQEIGLYMIFDIKLGDNFRRKARMVDGGHTTKTHSSVTYSSVISRYLVQIMLMIAALNNLDLQAVDIESSYLTDTASWMLP